MTIDPISNIAIISAVRPVSYYNGTSNPDIQRQRGDSFLASINSAAAKTIAINDKLDLSSEANASLNLEDLTLLVTQQPQLNPNSPVNKSQSAFQSVLESKKELTPEELIKSLDNRKKTALREKEQEERAKNLEAKKNEGSGFILTIPAEHLEEMKTYQTDYAQRNKLYDSFNSYQSASTGSLVNLTF